MLAFAVIIGAIISISAFVAGYIIGSTYTVKNRHTGTELHADLIEAVTPQSSRIVSPAKRAASKAFAEELNGQTL